MGVAREIFTHDPDPSNLLIMPKSAKITYREIKTEKVKKKGEYHRFILVKLRLNNDVKTPTWLVENLQANGLRSINPVVDVTNFVMLELGQPAHAYDTKKIVGGLEVSFGSPTQSLTTIDGVKRSLSHQDLIIIDKSGPVGLAGVIGGQGSEVSSKTQEVTIEIASFDKTLVRRTAQRHGLRTEASARFERGLPSLLPPLAAGRIVKLLENICHAELLDSPLDRIDKTQQFNEHKFGLRLRRAEALIGQRLDEAVVISGLRRLGLAVEHFSLSRQAQQKIETKASQLIDIPAELYRQIGIDIGSTTAEQAHRGTEVVDNNLKPGDVLFYESGQHVQNGVYIGQNKVLALLVSSYNNKTRRYQKLAQPSVQLVPVSHFLNAPRYLGTRRYIESFNHILAITVPWWRTDLIGEEDVVEEVAKIIGYENIELRLPTLPPQDTSPHQLLPAILQLKQELAAINWFEIMSYSFVSTQMIEKTGLSPDDHLSVANPASVEQSHLRSDFLASFLAVLQQNLSYRPPFGWFETARLFNPIQSSNKILVEETWSLGFLYVGKNSLHRLSDQIRWLASRAKTDLELKPQKNNWFVDGRAAGIIWKSELIGVIGQIEKSLLPTKLLSKDVAYAQLKLEPIAQSARLKAPVIPNYQLVSRDLTLKGRIELSWGDIEKVVRQMAGVNRYRFVGDFVGKPLLKTEKTITVRLWLDLGANPTSQHIDTQLNSITKKLQSTLHVTID